MAGEKKIGQSEAVDAGLESDVYTPMTEKEPAANKDGTIASDKTMSLTYAGNATSIIKEYDGNYNQLNANDDLNVRGGSYTPTQTDTRSYNPYSTRTFRSVDGKQSYISSSGYSSGYLQNSVSYGTTGIHGRGKGVLGSNVPVNPKGFSNPIRSNNSFGSRSSNLPLNTRSRQFIASPNFYKSPIHNPPLRPLDKLGSGYPSAGVGRGFQPVTKFSSYSSRNQGGYFSHDTAMSHRPNARMWNGGNRPDLGEKSDRHGQFEAMTELTRGPRDQSKSNSVNSSSEDKRMGLSMRRDRYNLEDFQTDYDNAKFFVIKSYSEDDVHKSIKYSVWSSTPNGNKKLDAAFRNTDGKTSESGSEAPVFLFYSVNGSGQFIGLSQMVGPVDFRKNMDFWQRNKWNGFFPVQWHIIKDLPNSQLRHIILENNENKPVTHSRDTQEIGLQQGLEMLKIFKSYVGKSSILDDFPFYEEREQSLKASRNHKPIPQTEMYRAYATGHKHPNAGERIMRGGGSYASNNFSDEASSLARLTRNLTLNSRPMRGSPVMNRRE